MGLRPSNSERPRPNVLGWGRTTALHDARLDAVVEHLLDSGTEVVLDLGCGSGALLEQLLLKPQLRRVIGVDNSLQALAAAEARLTAADGSRDPRLSLREGSVTDVHGGLGAVDAVALVETLEHLRPSQLSRLERALLVDVRPARVVMTTPNLDYNAVYGLQRGEYRHPDHCFEWGRAKFEGWASGVAGRTGYRVAFHGIGRAHAWLGSPTQMAVFSRSRPA
jgi:small RNA 2'-O-methyltransferase